MKMFLSSALNTTSWGGKDGSGRFPHAMSQAVGGHGLTLGRPGGKGPPMGASAAQIMLARETRVSYGPVPHMLDGQPPHEGSWRLAGDSFLLRTDGDHYFYYRKGEGVTIERAADADCSEEQLWLNGSVYAAIASINGLVPIHASAVAHDGRVFAFTGPSGAGKSTLIAALGDRGFPMFCDDTLVLDLSDPREVVCLPGHKRLKLTAEAIGLTGSERQEKVGPDIDKYFAAPAAGDVRAPLPLRELIFLEEGPDASIERLVGAERVARMEDDHYTSWLFAAARGFDRAGQFAHLARMAGRIAMAKFVRPHDAARFRQGVALVADYLSSESKEPR
jgi:hypothetical protein